MSRMPFAFILGLAGVCLQAQWLHQPTAGIPRAADGKPNLSAPAPTTPDGKPDLSGIWALTPGAGGITQLKPEDIKPWAQSLFKERQENLGSDGPGIQCLPGGFIAGGIGSALKVVQTPGLILMLQEDLSYRQIFMDGRQLPKDPNPAWMGYSVGHWEGDTLVVESTGYNERTWLEDGYPHTERMRLTERFRRRDFGHLDVDNTFSDPDIYAKAWTMRMNGLYLADTDLLEYVCAENEKDRSHLVGKKSDDTKRAVQLPPDVLSRYIGTYQFQAKELGLPVTGIDVVPVQISVEGNALQVGFGTGPKQTLIALSETRFTGFVGGEVDFGKDANGQEYLVLHVAEGDFRGNKAAATQSRIGILDRQGKVVSTLGEPGVYSQPAMSPDGTRVAAIRTDAAANSKNVWVFDITSGKAAAVASGALTHSSPVWSADGKQIAYVIADKQIFSIYRKASDGSGSEELLYTHTAGGAVVLTDWSPDGRICFWSGKLMYALNVNGDRKPIALFSENYNVRGGRFSPDGRLIAYNSDESGRFQAFVGPLNPVAKGQQISKDPAAGGIFWREDGKELYFLSLPPDQSVMTMEFPGSTPRVLFKLPSQIGAPAQLSSVASRDGQRFVFIVQTPVSPPAR